MLFMPQATDSVRAAGLLAKPYFQGVGLRPTGWWATPQTARLTDPVEAALCNEIPGMVEVSSSGEIHRNAVNVVMELKERGWIETDTSNFWLTPLSVHEAKISWLTFQLHKFWG